MDINEFRSNSSIQIQNMKATMSALRSQLDQEKEMLKNDIVQTLKCKSILGTGSADLLYTSGLLARLKSLEDNREPQPQYPAGTTSASYLKGRGNEETRKFVGAGEVYRPVYSGDGSSDCIRHCCSLKSAEAAKSISSVQMRSFSSQKFPRPTSVTHHNLDFSLPTVEEDPVIAPPETPASHHASWSGDASFARPHSKGYYSTEEPQPPTTYVDLLCNYRPTDPSYNPWLNQLPCHCAPYLMPSFNNCTSEPREVRSASRSVHCAGCCTRKNPEVPQSPVVAPPTELQQKEGRQCRNKTSHRRHGSPAHHCSPETSPRHYSHHSHQKVPRYNRRHQTKKNEKSVKHADSSVYKSDCNEAALQDLDDCQEQPVKSGQEVGTQIEELDDLVEIHCPSSPSTKKVQVTPRTLSPASTHSGKTRANLIYNETRDATPDDIVQYHYTNEISSQKSEGSSLFGSEIVLDEQVHHLTRTQKRTKARPVKPRRRGGKRSTGNQGTDKSGGETQPSGATIERSKSTPHPLHSRLAYCDPCEKAASETAANEVSKGRPKERRSNGSSQKNPRRSSQHPLLQQPPVHVPTSAHSVSRKKKQHLKNDPLKPLETFYASMAAFPWSKGKPADRSDVLLDRFESPRDLNTKVPAPTRKKSSKITRPLNPFSLILDELRTSPMLRNMSISSGRKLH